MIEGYVIRMMGLANGQETPLDGHYVISYDPTAIVLSGYYDAGLKTTPDAQKARVFATRREAWELAHKESGLPYPENMPLRAFHLVFDRVDAA